jgi:hypothetical protein
MTAAVDDRNVTIVAGSFPSAPGRRCTSADRGADGGGPSGGHEQEEVMRIEIAPRSRQVERPSYVWIAVVLEMLTGIFAVPVGWSFIQDPSGRGLGIPQGWIESTVFGSYFIPGLYLLAMNGFAMVALAALSVRRHWIAPWLTGALGVGLIIWIAVEIVSLPETMILTWVFLAIGFTLGFIALFWLRRTGQMQLW